MEVMNSLMKKKFSSFLFSERDCERSEVYICGSVTLCASLNYLILISIPFFSLRERERGFFCVDGLHVPFQLAFLKGEPVSGNLLFCVCDELS